MVDWSEVVVVAVAVGARSLVVVGALVVFVYQGPRVIGVVEGHLPFVPSATETKPNQTKPNHIIHHHRNKHERQREKKKKKSMVVGCVGLGEASKS